MSDRPLLDRPLYCILEVQSSATHDELRKAYHRLALKYHPDKAGDQGAEKFQQVLAAYTLLSDPEAREMYDKYGEQGISNMESMPAMKEVCKKMKVLTFYRVGFVIIAIVSICALTFFGLMAAKLDNRASYSWHVVVIPVYILFAFFSFATIASIIFHLKKWWIKRSSSDPNTLFDDMMLPNNRSKLAMECKFWLGHFMSLCVTVTGILIIVAAAQRDNGSDTKHYVSWWAAFSPVLVSTALSFLTAFVFRDLLHMHGVHGVSTLGIVLLNTISMMMIAARLVEIVLLICLLEGYLNVGSPYIAIPAEVYFALNACFFSLMTRLRVKGIEKIKREMPYMSEEAQLEINRRSMGHPSMWVEISFIIITNASMILGIVFSTLAEHVGFEYKLGFIPFYGYFGFMLLASIILFACFTIAIGSIEEKEVSEIQRKANTKAASDARPPFSPTSKTTPSKERNQSNSSSGGNTNKNRQEDNEVSEDSQVETFPQNPSPPNATNQKRSDDIRVEECGLDFDVDGFTHSRPSGNNHTHDRSRQQQQQNSDFRFEFVGDNR